MTFATPKRITMTSIEHIGRQFYPHQPNPTPTSGPQQTEDEMSKIIFETEPCERCGGCGEYSYCQAHGTTCFGCGGKGIQLTKQARRARKAVDKFLERYSKPVEAIQAGDQLRPSSSEGWETVIADACESRAKGIDKETGEYIPFISIQTKGAAHDYWPGTVLPIRPTVQQFNHEVVPFAETLAGVTVERCKTVA